MVATMSPTAISNQTAAGIIQTAGRAVILTSASPYAGPQLAQNLIESQNDGFGSNTKTVNPAGWNTAQDLGPYVIATPAFSTVAALAMVQQSGARGYLCGLTFYAYNSAATAVVNPTLNFGLYAALPQLGPVAQDDPNYIFSVSVAIVGTFQPGTGRWVSVGQVGTVNATAVGQVNTIWEYDSICFVPQPGSSQLNPGATVGVGIPWVTVPTGVLPQTIHQWTGSQWISSGIGTPPVMLPLIPTYTNTSPLGAPVAVAVIGGSVSIVGSVATDLVSLLEHLANVFNMINNFSPVTPVGINTFAPNVYEWNPFELSVLVNYLPIVASTGVQLAMVQQAAARGYYYAAYWFVFNPTLSTRTSDIIHTDLYQNIPASGPGTTDPAYVQTVVAPVGTLAPLSGKWITVPLGFYWQPSIMVSVPREQYGVTGVGSCVVAQLYNSALPFSGGVDSPAWVPAINAWVPTAERVPGATIVPAVLAYWYQSAAGLGELPVNVIGGAVQIIGTVPVSGIATVTIGTVIATIGVDGNVGITGTATVTVVGTVPISGPAPTLISSMASVVPDGGTISAGGSVFVSAFVATVSGTLEMEFAFAGGSPIVSLSRAAAGTPTIAINGGSALIQGNDYGFTFLVASGDHIAFTIGTVAGATVGWVRGFFYPGE